MYFKSSFSLVLILVQFSCIAGLLITGRGIPDGYLLNCFSAAGILLGIWSVFTMQINNLNIGPDIKADAHFINKGPYSIIRHPMYTAIILTFVPLVINLHTLFRLSLMLVLVTDLLVKIEHEEKILSKSFEKYKAYREHTWKILPYIY